VSVSVPPPTLSDRLAEGLLALIAADGLQPGAALPSVRELASRFEVTPPTIREALRRLQATDAVRLRHGSGIYVGDGISRTVLPNPNSNPLTEAMAVQLLDARLVLEPGIAAEAARHRTDAALVRLEAAVDTAHRDPEDPRPHLYFHRELASASGNPLLYEVVDSLLALRSREQRLVRLLIDDRQRDYDQHHDIYTAVRDGDPDAAAELTRAHLQELRDGTAARLA
jgi:DNA-binding FadR family transcriptional regulator